MGISVDDLDTQQRFSASFGEGLPFPLVADSQKEVAKAYGTFNLLKGNSKRMTFIVERDGTLSYINREVDARNEEQYKLLLSRAGVIPSV